MLMLHRSALERLSLLNAIGLQRQPFKNCLDSTSTSPNLKEYASLELGDGLKLFELRGVDLAGNTGVNTECHCVDLLLEIVCFHHSNFYSSNKQFTL